MIGRGTHPAADPTPEPRAWHRHALRPALIIIALICSTCALDEPAAAVSSPPPRPTELVAPSDVDSTLRALARLHSFGYTINTPARAERAIRHWQRVNGLTVDGLVGPEVLASLGLDRLPPTASVPAVRLDPPPAPAADAGMPETIEQIIRDIWPDELEDRALAIAHRESRLVPTARNSCCWGLFQIHWRAHRDWLATIGVTSPIQLLDARTNTTAALALYELDGWAPWSV